jgi:hypothetical protein
VEIESNDLPYNFGDWYGIEHFGGYLASLTENVNGVQGTAKARRMFAVNYLIASKPYAPDQVEVFSGRSGLKVYRNPGAYPRTWIVHEAVSITGNDQVGRLLDSAAFDPRRQTFLKGQAPNLEKCAQPETATLRTHLSNRIVIEANLSCRGMVIDSDTFFPGWEASVDGKPAAVYEAYGFLRGVVAEAGRHRIELRYRPKSVYQGAVLTALGLLGTCLLAALKW